MHHARRIRSEPSAAGLVEALECPAFLVGADGRITCANDAAANCLGGSASRPLTGDDLRRHMDPAAADTFLARAFRPASGGASEAALPARALLGGDGLAFSIAPLRYGRGAPVALLFQRAAPAGAGAEPSMPAPALMEAGPDDSRLYLDGLTDRELRWKVAVLSAEQGVWDHDFEHDRHFLSDTWRGIRGLGPDDPAATSTEAWLATIHPEDLDGVRAEMERQERGETEIVSYQFRQRHKDGRWLWILSRGRIVRRDRDGMPARMIGTDTDITDLKNAEMERRRLAERLSIAIDAAGMGIWEADLKTGDLTCDDRLLKIYGLADGDGRRSADQWHRLIHEDDRDQAVAYFKERGAARADISCDYRIVLPDGTRRYVRSRGKYVEEPGTPGRYHGVSIDVTRDYERTEELEAARASLEHDSRHDALTGLANRRQLDEVMRGKGMRGAARAILHFDIDHFKQINDTLGHDAGDATLVHVARILQNNMPDGALVARVGGDEFVALLFDPPGDDRLAEIAMDVIRDMSAPFCYGEHQCNINTSIGIAVSKDGDDALVIDADLALYQAKKEGRRRYRFYDAQMKSEARQRKAAFDALLAGFEQGEICCHYQPQFDARTLALSGLEALIRWESPTHGLIMPDMFLDTAEEMGLIAKLDDLVLRRAMSDLDHWAAHGAEVPRISVNVSAHRLGDRSLPERLGQLDLPRGMIAFELLESAFLDAKDDVVAANLAEIRRMGIEVEIDDFGSGHASILSVLQILPDRLKIDRELIRPITGAERQRDLVRNIVEIGRMLNVKVVAEGVETDEHVSIMRQLGCDFLQGYGLARPMNAAAVLDFIGQAQGNRQIGPWRKASAQGVG